MIPATREAESAPVAVRINGRLFPFTTHADVSCAYTTSVDASGVVAGTTAWAWRLEDVRIAPNCEILDTRTNDYLLVYDPRDTEFCWT